MGTSFRLRRSSIAKCPKKHPKKYKKRKMKSRPMIDMILGFTALVSDSLARVCDSVTHIEEGKPSVSSQVSYNKMTPGARHVAIAYFIQSRKLFN